MTNAVRMIDTVGQRLSALALYPYWRDRPVLSYTTRTYAATASQRGLFPHFIGIDQAPGAGLYGLAKIKDVEPGAASNGDVVALARAGARFVAYTFEANYSTLRREVDASGHGANVRYFVAWWTANEQSALNFLAGNPGVVAVQWASPTYGGDIVVPGTGHTVRDLNVDLSVGLLDFWLPKPAPAHASGTWRGGYSHTPADGKWAVQPSGGVDVKLGSEAITDYAVVGIETNTGQHHIKGIDRKVGHQLLGR